MSSMGTRRSEPQRRCCLLHNLRGRGISGLLMSSTAAAATWTSQKHAAKRHELSALDRVEGPGTSRRTPPGRSSWPWPFQPFRGQGQRSSTPGRRSTTTPTTRAATTRCPGGTVHANSALRARTHARHASMQVSGLGARIPHTGGIASNSHMELILCLRRLPCTRPFQDRCSD